MRSVWLAGTVAAVFCIPAFAQMTGHDFGTNGYQAVDPTRQRSNESPHRMVDLITARKIRELRQEAIRLQEADGGKLTDEHRAQLQAELDTFSPTLPADGMESTRIQRQSRLVVHPP